MKKLILIFIASCTALGLTAQAQDSTKHKMKKPYTHDKDLSRWVLDINFLGGTYMQDFKTRNTSGNYLNEITAVSNNGNLKFNNGSTFGGDAQIGLFFGKKKHWGLGTGFMYLYQQGDLNLDNFHVEYQATDNNAKTFRQLLTGNKVQEHVTSNNMNIPLVLKYKNRFSKHWGFTADAGALFNLQMKNTYNNNNSAFDYEAIYAYGEGNVPYFDQNATPNTTDQIITKAFLQQHLTAPNTVQSLFDAEASSGKNVGLGIKPAHNSGSESYTTGSVGLLVQPSINYFFSDRVALNVGAYYLYQPFKNSADNSYTLTNKVGDYTSNLHNITSSNAQSFGGNIGLRFFLCNPKSRTISSIDSMAPTLCGTCDGVITLHGFKKGKKIKVSYDYNGMAQTAYEGRVDGNGNVILKGLCAGSYTNITAKIKHHMMTGYPVSIVAPPLVITAQNSTDPSANGKCDGTITFNGLYAGKPVTVNYNFNGVPQPPYSGVVGKDNTVVLNNLCEGTYSNVVAMINTCTANGTDVTLTAPPPPPPAPDTMVQLPDISQPILFNFNKTTVHKSSIPLLEEAAQEMKADPNAILTVNAYTDAIGSKAYNQKLSVRRAQSVKSHLKQLGVSPKRVKTVGHGKSDPAQDNSTPEGRAQNRRAIMDIEDKK